MSMRKKLRLQTSNYHIEEDTKTSQQAPKTQDIGGLA